MITPTRLSYGVLAATIILAGLLHLGVPLLVVLFSYFALRQLYFLTKRKWLALILFGVVVAGIVAAGSLVIKTGLDPYRGTHRVKNNLYSICCDEVSTRFRDFYRSFATVMGAQIMISFINTILTAIFLFAVGLPHAPLLIAVTFLCGLVPIVGNLISNTIIVFIALTVSLKLAIGALVFLVAIHKLEYLLNSKIIGDRIRNPVWLTLIALIIGERLMGIPGLILAPVVLNYLRVEMLTVEVRPAQEKIELVKSPVHESFRS